MNSDAITHSAASQAPPRGQGAESEAALASGIAGQAGQPALACPNCGTDIRQTGFVAVTESYQAYNRTAGRLMKSHKGRSELSVLRCSLCCAHLDMTLSEVIGN